MTPAQSTPFLLVGLSLGALFIFSVALFVIAARRHSPDYVTVVREDDGSYDA